MFDTGAPGDHGLPGPKGEHKIMILTTIYICLLMHINCQDSIICLSINLFSFLGAPGVPGSPGR